MPCAALYALRRRTASRESMHDGTAGAAVWAATCRCPCTHPPWTYVGDECTSKHRIRMHQQDSFTPLLLRAWCKEKGTTEGRKATQSLVRMSVLGACGGLYTFLVSLSHDHFLGHPLQEPLIVPLSGMISSSSALTRSLHSPSRDEGWKVNLRPKKMGNRRCKEKEGQLLEAKPNHTFHSIM